MGYSRARCDSGSPFRFYFIADGKSITGAFPDEKVAEETEKFRGPEQRVSRVGALKAVTLDAAYSLQLEKEVGSIVPGKLANFTILADNPVTCDPMKIKDIAIWGTVHEGRVLPVKQPAAGGTAAVVRPALGPVLDAAALAALFRAEHEDHKGRHDDTCSAARTLAQAVGVPGGN